MSRARRGRPPTEEQRQLATLLAAFRSSKHHALTLSRRIAVSPCVVDAQVVQATAEAAALYGYAQPEEVVGQWQSSLQHPQDVSLCRAMAIRRHFGYDHIPHEYVIRIRQGDSARFRRVWKHTTQMELAGDTYWLTVLEETHAPLLADTLDITAAFPLPDSDEVQQYSGLMSVAEMMMRLQQTYSPWQPRTDLTPFLFQANMPAMQTSCHPEHRRGRRDTSASIVLPPGRTMALGDGTFLHRCGRCGVPWISRRADPVACPRQRADTRGPRCGKRTWRQVDEGLVYAANPPA